MKNFVWEGFIEFYSITFLDDVSEWDMNVSDRVAAEFLAKVYHPRIRSKSHFVHRRESPGFASILLVLPILNVG